MHLVTAAPAELLTAAGRPSVVAMGTFDGVHHGHRALVGAARRLAHSRGLRCTVVTFSPRPETYFRPDDALPDICSIDERVRRLKQAGADTVVVLPFNAAVARMGHEEFAELLTTHLQLRALYIGADFAFGRGRGGTPAALRALGLEVHEHGLLPNADGSSKASSSSIRRAIAAGMRREVALAQA